MTKKLPRVALLSVTDKTGIVEFARGLLELSFTLLSTGGTSKVLKDAGIPVTEVADFTKSPEVLGGRVKTLHPAIHAGILADRSNHDHQNDMTRMQWSGIDIVAVNLYDFAGEARAKSLPLEKAIEFVDVGGPTMLRAAAKNNAWCMPVIDPADYPAVLDYWRQESKDHSLRQSLARKVFAATSAYDAMIAEYFTDASRTPGERTLPEQTSRNLTMVNALRYGENAHQKAAFYRDRFKNPYGLASALFIQGKELSFNNYVDLDAAAAIVADLAPLPAMTIIKHTNPCGTAAGHGLKAIEIFERALSSDPKCAFGGIVASNIPIDESAARAMGEVFFECVIAPDYSQGALEVFAGKKNLRVLKSDAVLAGSRNLHPEVQWRSIHGGVLIQTTDSALQNVDSWQCVSTKKPDTTPNSTVLADLAFAMTVCKHVKSNAIVLASGLRTIGVGAGQMSRIDSARIAVEKAKELAHVVRGAVLASDAFFPFRDTVDFAARSGIIAIAQPGGSLRDQESITAANEHGIVMMMTGTRHFKH